jgi:hypothetical protein
VITVAARAVLVAMATALALTAFLVVTVARMERNDLAGGGSLVHEAVHAAEFGHDRGGLLRSSKLHDERRAGRMNAGVQVTLP